LNERNILQKTKAYIITFTTDNDKFEFVKSKIKYNLKKKFAKNYYVNWDIIALVTTRKFIQSNRKTCFLN